MSSFKEQQFSTMSLDITIESDCDDKSLVKNTKVCCKVELHMWPIHVECLSLMTPATQ